MYIIYIIYIYIYIYICNMENNFLQNTSGRLLLMKRLGVLAFLWKKTNFSLFTI